jgi:hypothetical protein
MAKTPKPMMDPVIGEILPDAYYAFRVRQEVVVKAARLKPGPLEHHARGSVLAQIPADAIVPGTLRAVV